MKLFYVPSQVVEKLLLPQGKSLWSQAQKALTSPSAGALPQCSARATKEMQHAVTQQVCGYLLLDSALVGVAIMEAFGARTTRSTTRALVHHDNIWALWQCKKYHISILSAFTHLSATQQLPHWQKYNGINISIQSDSCIHSYVYTCIRHPCIGFENQNRW